MAQEGSSKSQHFCLVFIAQPTSNNIQLNHERCFATKYISLFSLLCVWREYWLPFLTLWFFGQIWYNIYTWLGSAIVKPATVHGYILQFCSLGGFLKTISSTFYLIWPSCTWTVWHDRNSKVFQQKGNSIHQLIDKIKLQSFWWLKANHPNLTFSYHTW